MDPDLLSLIGVAGILAVASVIYWRERFTQTLTRQLAAELVEHKKHGTVLTQSDLVVMIESARRERVFADSILGDEVVELAIAGVFLETRRYGHVGPLDANLLDYLKRLHSIGTHGDILVQKYRSTTVSFLWAAGGVFVAVVLLEQLPDIKHWLGSFTGGGALDQLLGPIVGTLTGLATTVRNVNRPDVANPPSPFVAQ